jgi:hypothetical protein
MQIKNSFFRQTMWVDLALVFGALALIQWPGFARLIRGQFLDPQPQLRFGGARPRHADQPHPHPLCHPQRDDLFVISRTSQGGYNQHDTNLVTLHRIEKFRVPALNLKPTYRRASPASYVRAKGGRDAWDTREKGEEQ